MSPMGNAELGDAIFTSLNPRSWPEACVMARKALYYSKLWNHARTVGKVEMRAPRPDHLWVETMPHWARDREFAGRFKENA